MKCFFAIYFFFSFRNYTYLSGIDAVFSWFVSITSARKICMILRLKCFHHMHFKCHPFTTRIILAFGRTRNWKYSDSSLDRSQNPSNLNFWIILVFRQKIRWRKDLCGPTVDYLNCSRDISVECIDVENEIFIIRIQSDVMSKLSRVITRFKWHQTIQFYGWIVEVIHKKLPLKTAISIMKEWKPIDNDAISKYQRFQL